MNATAGHPAVEDDVPTVQDFAFPSFLPRSPEELTPRDLRWGAYEARGGLDGLDQDRSPLPSFPEAT